MLSIIMSRLLREKNENTFDTNMLSVRAFLHVLCIPKED